MMMMTFVMQLFHKILFKPIIVIIIVYALNIILWVAMYNYIYIAIVRILKLHR